MTLALNVTDPLLAGQTGKAAFDAVGPLLLIGWSEVGPGLLQTISTIQRRQGEVGAPLASQRSRPRTRDGAPGGGCTASAESTEELAGPHAAESLEPATHDWFEDDLLARAHREDARHWREHQRPISAETLRKRLHIGAARSRVLVGVIRSGNQTRRGAEPSPPDP